MCRDTVGQCADMVSRTFPHRLAFDSGRPRNGRSGPVRPPVLSPYRPSTRVAAACGQQMRYPDMQIRDGIVEAIGHTPLIKLERASRGHRLHHSRQGRVHESGRLGEGSRRPADDPGGGEARRTAPRRPGGGGDRRQYRHRARAGRQCARLPHAHRHSADAEPGKEGHAAAVPAPSWSRCRRCPSAIRTITSMSAAGSPSNSRRREKNGVIFADQWNNLDNRKAHYVSTGPEIWERDRRQDRRLHLRGRHRRHARRRVALSARKEKGHRHRRRRSARRGDVQSVRAWRGEGERRRLDHRRHRARPRHADHRRPEGRQALSHSRRGGACR